jgi:hypothetical protein
MMGLGAERGGGGWRDGLPEQPLGTKTRQGRFYGHPGLPGKKAHQRAPKAESQPGPNLPVPSQPGPR